MLETIKHNNIKTPREEIKFTHLDSESKAEIVKRTSKKELIIKLDTTTDVLVDFLSNVVSVLLSTDMIIDDSHPKVILRQAHQLEPEIGGDQMQALWRIKQENAMKAGMRDFQFGIENGLTFDQAASILPIGMTMVSAVVSVDVDSVMEDISSNMSEECAELILMAQKAISE